MLSKLVPPVTIHDTSQTGRLTDSMRSPFPGDPMKIFIPDLMSKMSPTAPSITTETVRGGTLFVNDPDCKPVTKRTLKSQNYITITCGKNVNWDGIDKIQKDDSGRILLRELQKGTVFNCNFIGGLLSHGIIETDRDDATYDTRYNTSSIYSGDMDKVDVSNPEDIGKLSDQVNDLIDRLQDSKILGKKIKKP